MSRRSNDAEKVIEKVEETEEARAKYEETKANDALAEEARIRAENSRLSEDRTEPIKQGVQEPVAREIAEKAEAAKATETMMNVQGIMIPMQSIIDPARLRLYQDKPARNCTPMNAINLAAALSQIPKFSGLQLFVAPSAFEWDQVGKDGIELSQFLQEGVGANEPINIYFRFPAPTGNEVHKDLNGGYLLEHFAQSVDHGVSTILQESYHDGRPAILTIVEAPYVKGMYERGVKGLFEEFLSAPIPAAG